MFNQDILTPVGESGLVVALGQVRQSVLQRATSLIAGTSGLHLTEQFDALPNMSALLMTSLEELKVAEEELRQQNLLLQEQRAGIETRAQRYERLFVQAPAPAIITDTLGTIQESNAAAGRLLRRDPAHLEQKPFQALIPATARENFRRQLERVSLDDGVADWRLTLSRVGDLPVNVTATVQFIDSASRSGSGGLYWMLRVLDGGE